MDPAQKFQRLLGDARAGDDEAAAELVREYGPELQRYVRFRLTNPAVRRLVDSLDVCQSVLAAFFVDLQEGAVSVGHPRQLCRLLALMAERRIVDKARWQGAARRGGGAAALEDTVEHVGREPDPAETVADRELVELLRGRLTGEDRDAVDRWLAGEPWAEIAAAVGGTPEAVRKRVTRSVDRAARELGLIEDRP